MSVALAVVEVVAASEVVDLTDASFDAFIAEHEATMVSSCCCGMCPYKLLPPYPYTGAAADRLTD